MCADNAQHLFFISVIIVIDAMGFMPHQYYQLYNLDDRNRMCWDILFLGDLAPHLDNINK